ncbi:hypothetical protein DFJ73DRAFT_825307 [Zopfochytrium polystomum]|nr:hypothetical protein DFJ73DRAFT_825307 [Zopfochytrium polystomum]
MWQQYLAIFEDALDQLGVLGDISLDQSRHGGGVGGINNLSNAESRKPASDEIPRILRDQKSLETRFHELLNDQDRLKSLPNKTKFKENQLAILDVSSDLQKSTQVLARNLKAHPSVAQNLIKIQSERNTFQALVSKSIRELRDGKFDSLVNTVEEEKRKRNTLQNTINRENEASELQRELQRELANEKRFLEDEIADRNQVIQQLKDTIQEINSLTTSEQKYIKKETKAHENSVKQRCQARELQLREEQALLNKKIEQENRAHEVIVDFLARQRRTLDSQIQDWMTKYEEDTEAKANELEALKQKRTQDLDKFEELVAAYEALEKVVEEDRQTKQREAEEKRIQQERLSACITLQRWWRRTIQKIQKANIKSAKKPGKKEGKKGGGKKKK